MADTIGTLERVKAFLDALPPTDRPDRILLTVPIGSGPQCAILLEHDLRILHGAASAPGAFAAPGRTPPHLPGLSQRQLQVIELIARGCTTAEIATWLNLMPLTVKGHTARALRAFGVTSRAALATEAIRRGYLALTPDGRHWKAVQPAQNTPTRTTGENQ